MGAAQNTGADAKETSADVYITIEVPSLPAATSSSSTCECRYVDIEGVSNVLSMSEGSNGKAGIVWMSGDEEVPAFRSLKFNARRNYIVTDDWFSPLPLDDIPRILGELRRLLDFVGLDHNIQDRMEILVPAAVAAQKRHEVIDKFKPAVRGPELTMTLQELSVFNGLDGAPMYIGVLGRVHDVTSSRNFQPGVGYAKTPPTPWRSAR
eukprot:TRINITY_DN22417_c0_g4_i1.p1 TRINITY_DN22417_c0_g4~~TRINITY_DN22417_c0_g4_i1.p1  ORF type:complete len:208 (-),score=46.91 TRINITY_DN22417_c0_g4_i1:560-1183(-)